MCTLFPMMLEITPLIVFYRPKCADRICFSRNAIFTKKIRCLLIRSLKHLELPGRMITLYIYFEFNTNFNSNAKHVYLFIFFLNDKRKLLAYHYKMAPYVAVYSYCMQHDDVIKWKHFPRNWSFVRGIHRWILRTKASDAELWCFLWFASE